MVGVFTDLQPQERQVTGQWKEGVGGSTTDSVDARIFWLVTTRLQPKGRTDDGWTALFLDQRDGRFWELTFPHGSLFGGGPRELTWLPVEDVELKYGRGVRD